MVSMSANIELQNANEGRPVGAIKRAAGGERFYIDVHSRGGPVSHAGAGRPGDIAAIELRVSLSCAIKFPFSGRSKSNCRFEMGRRKVIFRRRRLVRPYDPGKDCCWSLHLVTTENFETR